MTTILLVRHGQTEWNRIERFRGRIDLELNPTGLDQARKTAIRIQRSWKPDVIYSSPLTRAIQTASAIAELTHNQVESTSDLIDIDYGEWQGLTPEKARLRWPAQIDAWYQHPEQAIIPGGENLSRVQNRAIAFIHLVSKTNVNNTLLLVSHTVVNRLILLGLLGLGIDHFWRLRQEPCAINIIEVKNGDFSLVTMNDTCHLEE
ncbi:MAG TPA: histidine phosphatase family protein [Bellilinea sp.]|nr:histidine phosphatase family protein [Bellilinea sp.]